MNIHKILIYTIKDVMCAVFPTDCDYVGDENVHSEVMRVQIE